MKWDIFLAHAGAVTRQAEHLYDFLNPPLRVFLDSRSLELGDDWDSILPDAQRESEVTVVLISSGTERSFYDREEIASAIALAREDPSTHRVVPIYLDSNAQPPYGLRRKHGATIGGNVTLETVARLLIAQHQARSESAQARQFDPWRRPAEVEMDQMTTDELVSEVSGNMSSQEAFKFLSALQRQRHETAMSIIRNIK